MRLIAPFDHIFVAQAATDRARIADPDLFAATSTPNGRSPRFVPVDGRLAGTWKADGERIGVDCASSTRRRRNAEADEEAQRLAAFLAS